MGKVGTEVAEAQSAEVQRIGRVGEMTRISGDTVLPENIGSDIESVANIENELLEEEAVNPGTLTSEEAAQIEEAIVRPEDLDAVDGLLMTLECSASAPWPSSWRYCNRKPSTHRGPTPK